MSYEFVVVIAAGADKTGDDYQKLFNFVFRQIKTGSLKFYIQFAAAK